MSASFDKALRDLNEATEALIEADQSDTPAVCSALEKRADAITRIAFLAAEAGGHAPSVLDQLASALARGDQATRRVLNMKQDATEEWNRLRQIRDGLGDTREHEISYSG
jgi:hypothetical protein